jgi:transcriptional regulator with XRE-family HTH domain
LTRHPPWRLLIGTALWQYRENLGYILDDAARVLDSDRSKISRIETGQRSIRPKELRELLTEYGVGEQEQGTLTAIAQAGRRSNLGQNGSAMPVPCQEYLALERAASAIRIYDPQKIPDLLQTPGLRPGTNDRCRAQRHPGNIRRTQTHPPAAPHPLARAYIHQPTYRPACVG